MSAHKTQPNVVLQMAAALLLFVMSLLAVAQPSLAADLTFNRAYQGSISGQTYTTTTALNADAGSIRFSDGGTQRAFQNTSGTLYYKIGGVQFSEAGVLNSRYPNGNTLMDAVAFSGTGGDRLLVLGGSYTTSSSYSGSSNAIVAKLNEYVDATAPDPAQTTLLVNGGSSASAVVGGTATIVVTTKLTSGAALTGATVTVSGNPSNASSISPNSATSDGAGKATFTVTGLQSGTVTYSATASANGTTTTSAGTVSVTYTGVRSAAQSTASVPNGTAGAATTVVVTVRDSGGAVVTGAASGLAATIGGTNTGATVSAITDNGNGAYSFTYTPASAGVDSVAITLDSTAISGSPYSSTVSAPAIAITTTTLPTPVIGVAYSQTVATSGGTAPVTFSVSAGSLPAGLSLAASTGVISGTATTAGAYSFTITATDNNSVTATRTYTGTIGAALTITTTTLPTPVIGVAYSQTVATSGGTAPVTFSVSAGALPAGLSLAASTGVISGTATTSGAYSFTITATDNNSITDAKTYTGTIGSGLAITTATLPNPVIGVAYSQTVATSGGTVPLTFSVSAGALPAGLSLAASTGVISGAATTPGAYSFTITATDNNSITDAKTYTGTIGSGLAITTATLPTPVIGVAYSQTVATSGGTVPVTFSVSAGALPAGLSLAASTGVISGTATTSGAYSFTITATDNNSITDAKTYTGTIGSGLAITTATLPTPVINVAYSQTVATSGGTVPVTFSVSAGALPAGLSLAAATGVISGMATTPGAYSFTITATDNNSITASQAYSGTISAGLSITTTSLPTPVAAVAYSQTVATSGGTAPVTFSISGGSLPAGLSLNTSTGVISGTPTTPGAYSFTLTATDSNGISDAQAYSGTVGARLAITTVTLPTPVIGMTYSQAIATAGGTAPVIFSVSAGSLPAGLSLNPSTGAISGTATTSGPYSFTITATDANNITDAKSYSGAINERVSISSGSLATPIVGEALNVAVTASGGTGPYAFAVSGGALPAGLSLSPTGQISGTPTTAGPFSVTIEVTDANGQKASLTLSGTVGQALVAEDQSIEVAYNGSVSITLASLGADDTIAMQSGVSNGKLTVAGAVATYEPAQGYIGSDSFSFSVKRGGGASRVATVKIKVLPPPPPTAESPTDQTLDTTAEDDAAVVVDQLSFDLASLVKGIVTDVRIEALPKHGKVEMVRAAAAPVVTTVATRAKSASAALAVPAPAFTAVYTADKGYVGRDSFTFVAIGPGGVSAPALVNIEVVKSKPTAPVLKVSALGGRKIVIDLTAAALDGPFIGAALVSKPAESVGASRLVESGTADDRRYTLEFTSKGATMGECASPTP